jgi:hypothetical protein
MMRQGALTTLFGRFSRAALWLVIKQRAKSHGKLPEYKIPAA